MDNTEQVPKNKKQLLRVCQKSLKGYIFTMILEKYIPYQTWIFREDVHTVDNNVSAQGNNALQFHLLEI